MEKESQRRMHGKPVWSASEGRLAVKRQMNSDTEMVRGSGSTRPLPQCWIAKIAGVERTTPQKTPRTMKKAAIIPATSWCWRTTLLQHNIGLCDIHTCKTWAKIFCILYSHWIFTCLHGGYFGSTHFL